jgi:hypothetical protein
MSNFEVKGVKDWIPWYLIGDNTNKGGDELLWRFVAYRRVARSGAKNNGFFISTKL